jgi:hypothetical protein
MTLFGTFMALFYTHKIVDRVIFKAQDPYLDLTKKFVNRADTDSNTQN